MFSNFMNVGGRLSRSSTTRLYIFFSIAGTYTPFTLVYLRGNWGWTLFGAV